MYKNVIKAKEDRDEKRFQTSLIQHIANHKKYKKLYNEVKDKSVA